MTITELRTMTTEQMIAWMKADARSSEPETWRVQRSVLEALQAGQLSDDDFLERWIAANDSVGESLLAEADELRRYKRAHAVLFPEDRPEPLAGELGVERGDGSSAPRL